MSLDMTLAGVAFSIASAVLCAGFTLVSGRLSQSLGAGPATTCLTVVAAIVMGLSGLYRPLAWPTEVAPEVWLLYLGLVTAALALLGLSWGAARLSPTALAVATLEEPMNRSGAGGASSRPAPEPRTVGRRRFARGQHLGTGPA